MRTQLIAATAVLSFAVIGVVPAEAQRGGGAPRGGSAPRGGTAVGRAVPRSTYRPPPGPGGRPGVGGPYYRPYYPYYGHYRPYYYGPGWGVNFYVGIPFGYYGSYGYYGGYGYYGYPYYYGPYGYRYGYPYYGYPYPPGYVAVGPGAGYGGVRITNAPKDAQVFVDGYYVGIVDNFDGTFQQINLETGRHRVEIRPVGEPPIGFDVDIAPGRTVTYSAR